MSETIFALATPNGKSGVAVIRISGENTLAVSDFLGIRSALKPRYAHYVELKNPANGRLIDQAIVIYFPAPHSFTGENVLEIHCHGSKAVITELTELLLNSDLLRYAEAGEFTRRALENNKMDLIQAEALIDLIDAETIAQRDLALRQMGGEVSLKFERLENAIIEARAFAEVHLDFPDDDIPNDIIMQLNAKIMNCDEQINELLVGAKVGKAIRDGIKVAIIGAPNVGKSTLLNAIAGQKVAITSDVAGTTRDAIAHYKEIAGVMYCFYDTAGLRESGDAIEAEGVLIAKELAEQADLLLAVIDGSLDLRAQIEHLEQNVSRETILIVNKSDLLRDPESEVQNIKENVSRETFLVSAINADQAQEKILSLISQKNMMNNAQIYVTRERQIKHLQDASQNIILAMNSEDLIIKAQYLIYACDAAAGILGKIDVERVLDALFSNFCIGK
jgi:tRNA modification GTPase